MKPHVLLDAARKLVDAPLDRTGGLWARAATFLARQALEQRMSEILVAKAPGSDAARFTSKLLILGEVLGDRELAKRVSFTWSALSSAGHVQGFELAPTATELRDWIEEVERFLADVSHL